MLKAKMTDNFAFEKRKAINIYFALILQVL